MKPIRCLQIGVIMLTGSFFMSDIPSLENSSEFAFQDSNESELVAQRGGGGGRGGGGRGGGGRGGGGGGGRRGGGGGGRRAGGGGGGGRRGGGGGGRHGGGGGGRHGGGGGGRHGGSYYRWGRGGGYYRHGRGYRYGWYGRGYSPYYGRRAYPYYRESYPVSKATITIIEDAPSGENIRDVHLDGSRINLEPPSPRGYRGIYTYQLNPGQHEIEWTVTSRRGGTQTIRKTFYVERYGDAVNIVVDGDEFFQK